MRSIQDTVESVPEKEIIDSVKKEFKRMKVEGKRDKVDENEENKTFYTNNGYERSR